MRIKLIAAAATGVAALALTACGPSTYTTPHPATHSTAAHHHAAPKYMATAPQGMTLYVLTADRPHHSTCTGYCLTVWPASGRTTPDGMPTYTYVGDSAPGDANGDGMQSYGGTWIAVHNDGTWK